MKSYLLRQAAFGRRVAVLDPKGEYGPLARFLGAEPIKLLSQGRARVNPLEPLRRRSDTSGPRAAGPVPSGGGRQRDEAGAGLSLSRWGEVDEQRAETVTVATRRSMP